MTRVDILFFEGCPNHVAASKLVHEVVADLGVEADIREVEVLGVEEALAIEFLGSPSIRVDGRDIEPAGRRRTDFGFACRTYSGEGLPPREMLIAALRGEPYSRSANADEIDPKAGDCCSLADAGDAASAVDKKPGRAGLLAAGGAFVAAVLASALQDDWTGIPLSCLLHTHALQRSKPMPTPFLFTSNESNQAVVPASKTQPDAFFVLTSP